jgi:hypothetical protein
MTQAMQVLACLPATPRELTAVMGWRSKAVHDALYALRAAGWVTRTDRWVLTEGRVRLVRSRLWVAVDENDFDGPDVNVGDADFARVVRHGLLRRYRAVKARCAALHWQQRHAFTGMGLQ